jgi:hypothetical protein
VGIGVGVLGFVGVGVLTFVGVGVLDGFIGVLVGFVLGFCVDGLTFVGVGVGIDVFVGTKTGVLVGTSVGATVDSSVGSTVGTAEFIGSVETGSSDCISEGTGVISDIEDTVGYGSDPGTSLPGITKATNNMAIKLTAISPLIIFKTLRYFSLLSMISHPLYKFLTKLKYEYCKCTRYGNNVLNQIPM